MWVCYHEMQMAPKQAAQLGELLLTNTEVLALEGSHVVSLLTESHFQQLCLGNTFTITGSQCQCITLHNYG